MNKFMKKIMSKKDGFTLVELIVVIAILAILAGVAVPAYTAYINKAEEGADVAILANVLTATQAALIEEGSVTSISVVTGSGGAVTKITAAVGAESFVLLGGTSSEDISYADEFNEYYTGNSATTPSIKLNDETGAYWSANEWKVGQTS